MLNKAIPSFINDIKSLISEDKVKHEIVKTLLEGWLSTMESEFTIDGKEQDPLAQCFLYLYLSQVYIVENRFEDALEFVEKGIKHTPTLIELH